MLHSRWAEEDLTFLEEWYAEIGPAKCAEHLGRNYAAVTKKANRLGLNKPRAKTHEQYEQELFDKQLEAWPLEKYINACTPIKHTCIEGHEWMARPNTILAGHGCSVCANKGGFRFDAPATLYYVKIEQDNLKYYKIGITNKTLSDRFSKDKDKQITVLMEQYFDKGVDAHNEEQNFLREFKHCRQNIAGWLSTGNSELFEIDVLKLDS